MKPRKKKNKSMIAGQGTSSPISPAELEARCMPTLADLDYGFEMPYAAGYAAAPVSAVPEDEPSASPDENTVTSSQPNKAVRSKMSPRAVFSFSFAFTFFVLLVSIGFIFVDYEGRKMSFGDDTPPFQVEEQNTGTSVLEIKTMGLHTEVDVTRLDNFFDFLCEFGCIPHQ